MGILRYVYPSANLGPFNDEIVWFFISQESYIKLNWQTFQNDWKTYLSISVLHNM